MIRLLVKTYDNHKKYLCKTVREDYLTYRGSGNRVTDDLEVIDTEVLFETEDKKVFKEVAIHYSTIWNVETNPLFLNETIEQGQGGNTGEEGYKKAKAKRSAKMLRPEYKLLRKYQKRFRFSVVDDGTNFSQWPTSKLKEELEKVYDKYGKPEDIEWNGYVQYANNRTKEHEANRAMALRKPRKRVDCPKCGMNVGSNNLTRHQRGPKCGG